MTAHLLRLLAIATLACAGCGRCGGNATNATNATASSGSATGGGSTATSDAGADAMAPMDPALAADVPEVKDDGSGRATAALRAVLTAFGIAFDAAALEKECNVDEDGASIDDLEDVAVKHGLEAGSVIVPAEHVLLAATKMLPAIVITDKADDEQEFVVVWRLDGGRAQVMDPIEGRSWVPRADLEKILHVHEMAMPLDEYREAIAAPAFLTGLEVRMSALDVDGAAARGLIDRAVADPGWRGIGALDASIRKLTRGGPRGKDALMATFGCAFEKQCDGVESVPPALWSVQPAPKGPQGEAQVKARGAVLLAIAGRAAAP